MRSRGRSPFLLLAAAGVGAVALIGVLLSVQLREAGIRDAERDSEQSARLTAKAVVEPAITEGVLAGEPAALARLDALVRARVLDESLLRIKIWAADGRIVYSDEPRLVGRRFPLEQEERSVLETGEVQSEIADLREPDNRYERGQRDLLEVYFPIMGPDGRPLVYESYQRFDSITTSGRRLWTHLLPSLLGGLLLLQLANLGLASWFGARLRRSDRKRAALLWRALDTSDAERRRIAADLRDGVVHDLTPVSSILDRATRRLDGVAEPETLSALADSATTTRRSVRVLRALIGDVYPPERSSHGLDAALRELAGDRNRPGLTVELDIGESFDAPTPAQAVLLRVAQEGLRNSATRAGATRVVIRVGTDREAAWLEVRDNGFGPEPGRGVADTLFGLRSLEELLDDAGGRLHITSVPGRGTVLRAEVPTP